MNDELAAITAEHRQCQKWPKYDGCYSHFTGMAHCRADGMAWPCDVARIAALIDLKRRLEINAP